MHALRLLVSWTEPQTHSEGGKKPFRLSYSALQYYELLIVTEASCVSLLIKPLVNMLFSQQYSLCGGLVLPFEDMISC